MPDRTVRTEPSSLHPPVQTSAGGSPCFQGLAEAVLAAVRAPLTPLLATECVSPRPRLGARVFWIPWCCWCASLSCAALLRLHWSLSRCAFLPLVRLGWAGCHSRSGRRLSEASRSLYCGASPLAPAPGRFRFAVPPPCGVWICEESGLPVRWVDGHVLGAVALLLISKNFETES